MSQMVAEASPLDVRAALRGERIFISGATGFVGKVLVEKLLWSIPDLGQLVLLVRPKDGMSGVERLEREILEAPLMARLRALHADDWEGWVDSKVSVIEGDLASDLFGLEPDDYMRVADSIDRVVASAATVSFDERLDRALELNARGALRGLQLARDAGNAPLLHLSTCFVSGRRRALVEERVMPPRPVSAWAVDADSILAGLDAASQQHADSENRAKAAGRDQAERYGFHDVYTLTKALGERLIEARRGPVPVAILRPAIIESAVSEPIPGWIEGVRVTDPLVVAYGRGSTRDFPGRPDTTLEVVPVDHVVNASIVALAALPTPSHHDRPPVAVYQLASGRNPISLGELVAHAEEGFTRSPMRDAAGQPIAVRPPRFVPPPTMRKRLARGRARCLRLAKWSPTARWRARGVTGERQAAHFLRLLDIYEPYLDHGASYDDSAVRDLSRRLSVEESAAFPFDIEAVDWESYIAETHVPGLQRFALHAEDGRPAPARQHDAVAAAHERGDYPAAQAATTYELLSRAAESDPGAVAFQTCRQGHWLRYTYGQSVTAVSNIASRLERRYGIAPGDRVVLWGTASPEWVLTSFAIHRLGAVTVPLDPQWPAAEVAQAAAFTEARLICAAPGLADQVGADAPPVVPLAAPFVPEPDVGLLPGSRISPSAAQPGDLACILFTSGTTVAPKAVPLTHDNLLSNVRDLVPFMHSSRERLLSVLPIHHVFEFTVGLLVPLVGGGSISYVAELKPAEISWMMQTTRPTVLVAVPRLLALLLNGVRQSVAAGGPALRALFKVLFALSALTGGRIGHRLFGKVHQRFGGALRRIATGGSALEPELGRTFGLMGFRVAEGYGMTETSPVMTVNPWDRIQFGSAGQLLPSVEIDVRPVNGEDEGTGELWVRGPNVMAGYYRNTQATAEAFDGKWFSTGDIGGFDRHGRLRIAGRSKDVIVTSAGKNVYPEEVEYRYRDLPAVEELIVIGLPDSGGGERVVGVAVAADATGDAAAATIEAAVAERSVSVPSYQRIARVVTWVGELPKTTTLKVKRAVLRDAVLAGESAGARQAEPKVDPAPVPSRSDEELWVTEAICRLTPLRAESIAADSHLEQLGIDSLTHVALIAELEAFLDCRIDDEVAGGLRRVEDVVQLVRSTREPAGAGTRTQFNSPSISEGPVQSP